MTELFAYVCKAQQLQKSDKYQPWNQIKTTPKRLPRNISTTTTVHFIGLLLKVVLSPQKGYPVFTTRPMSMLFNKISRNMISY